ncbi:hypothetical protein RIF29_13709 [Crotalaria pallida]|uniref:Uncharacterized protein n=1 Tax=Crotalaria pallida TaxID=3830 RepID=A0AAN9IQ41_CROPI
MLIKDETLVSGDFTLPSSVHAPTCTRTRPGGDDGTYLHLIPFLANTAFVLINTHKHYACQGKENHMELE